MKQFRIIAFSLLFGFGLLTSQVNGQFTLVPNLPKYDLAPYHFGFSLAVNQMFFTIDPIENYQSIRWGPSHIPDFFADSAYILGIEGRYTYGFTIGIISNLRVGKYFDLRFLPDLSFGERELHYTIKKYWKDGEEIIVKEKKIYSTYVDFPLRIKYKSKRLHNMRAYLIGGARYSIDLASEAKKNQDELDDKHIKLKKNDVAIDGGVGFDFYTTYFKFGIELTMSYSPLNALVEEDNLYTNSIERLSSKIFTFSFTFE